MAYNELIKNFNRIRDYMREFYVYGFKRRDEYTKKSPRSYDDEKRRMESILGDYMCFRNTSDGKNVFLSIDSRLSGHNPLYKAWKAKSFTDGDITLHFLLLDILEDSPGGIEVSDILNRIYEIIPEESGMFFDESTVRKKLREYVSEGIARCEKRGRRVFYFPEKYTDISGIADALDFYSEVSPCGVIGSFILDKSEQDEGILSFKHHYITSALDSEILCNLFDAMREKQNIVFETVNRLAEHTTEISAVPVKIMISVQSGRQYLMAYVPRFQKITAFRIDYIVSVRPDGPCEAFDKYREDFIGIQNSIWGVSTTGRSGNRPEHVDFTVQYGEDEQYIPLRLEREKRCGTVEYIGRNMCRFSADVFDTTELVPWIRTFICRITEFHFSDKMLQEQFEDDLRTMYGMYGIAEGGDSDAVQ